MAAVEGPFCFAVADYEDAWVGHGGVGLSWRGRYESEGSIGVREGEL